MAHSPRDARDAAGRCPDGDRVPIPARPSSPPVTRWQMAYGLLCAVVVLVLLVVGVIW